MSGNTTSRTVPRAMIHQRVLDVARANPTTPVDELAPLVSGATPTLVRRVIETYGDPGANDDATTPDDQPMSKSDTGANGAESPIDHASDDESSVGQDHGTTLSAEVDEKQRETLRAIYEHPDASQRQLAGLLDVSHSTVSHRLNEIPGFEWENRWAIVKDRFEDDSAPGEFAAEFDARLQRVERRVDELGGASGVCLEDPDLVHKVVHACMASEQISEEEELRILKSAMPGRGE